jgi:hypothetical protein
MHTLSNEVALRSAFDASVKKIDSSRETEAQLRKILALTHDVSLEFNHGYRDTCVLTSYALTNVLRRLGADAYPLRVETGAFPRCKKLGGIVLGRIDPPLGAPRTRSEPGFWKGHLVVAIGKEWLLDATLDQVNNESWPPSAWVSPALLRLSNDFWSGGQISMEENGTFVRYSLYAKQHGFANAPDARPSHWKLLADTTMDVLAGMHCPLDCRTETAEIGKLSLKAA